LGWWDGRKGGREGGREGGKKREAWKCGYIYVSVNRRADNRKERLVRMRMNRKALHPLTHTHTHTHTNSLSHTHQYLPR